MKTVAWTAAFMGLSLAVTLILELAFSWFWKIRDKKELLLVIAANFMTNPAVTGCYYLAASQLLPAVWPETGSLPLKILKWTLEAAAVAAEALCYQACSRNIRRPWLFSAGANLFSYGTGALLQKLL